MKRRMTLWRWIHPVPRNAQAFKKPSSPVLLSMLFEFRALHSICGSVTKLSISLFRNRVGGRGQVAADTLYECLHAWSRPTLEYLKIDVQRLSEAISSLKALRELQITRLKLDLASISRLSPLERFAILFRPQMGGRRATLGMLSFPLLFTLRSRSVTGTERRTGCKRGVRQKEN